MTKIDYEGRVLRIGNKQIELPRPIKDVVEIGEIVIVRTEYTTTNKEDRNVWGFNLDGSNRWRIPVAPHETESSAGQTYVSLSEEDE